MGTPTARKALEAACMGPGSIRIGFPFTEASPVTLPLSSRSPWTRMAGRKSETAPTTRSRFPADVPPRVTTKSDFARAPARAVRRAVESSRAIPMSRVAQPRASASRMKIGEWLSTVLPFLGLLAGVSSLPVASTATIALFLTRTLRMPSETRMPKSCALILRPAARMRSPRLMS
jgi:hypothetical protein